MLMTKRFKKIGYVAAGILLFLTLCVSLFAFSFRRPCRKTVRKYAISPPLAFSVIKAESGFSKDAKSDAGATGLMQLMPDTYEHCAKALGVPRTENAEFDVDNSLRCGCYYLSLMLEKYDGNVDHALMAYNAGESNADKFIAGAPVFGETQKYIKDVALAQKVYGFFA